MRMLFTIASSGTCGEGQDVVLGGTANKSHSVHWSCWELIAIWCLLLQSFLLPSCWKQDISVASCLKAVDKEECIKAQPIAGFCELQQSSKLFCWEPCTLLLHESTPTLLLPFQ